MTKGFGEERQQSFSPAAEAETPEAASLSASRAKVKVGPGGRVVIPAPMREALGIGEGDVLVATLDVNGLRLTTMGSALAYARSIVRDAAASGGSWADELIADRRREAERESGE